MPSPAAWRVAIAVADLVIAQLARSPQPGRVKTRMLPALSPERAAELHAAMLLHTCRSLCDFAPLELWVDGDEQVFAECLAAGARGPFQQCEGDLGQRMAHIAERGLSRHSKIVLVGSDAPALDAAYLAKAAKALEEVDVVFGPALDGGYVLLGLSRHLPALFEGIPWGSGDVLQRSIEAVEASACSYALLEALPDIDRPEDLRYLPEDFAW